MKKNAKSKPAQAGTNPGRLMDIGRAFQQSQILFTANELGLFDALAEGPKTPSETARKLKVKVRGADILMHALAAMDLLVKDGERFRLAPVADRHLVAGRPGYMGNILRHSANLQATWGQLTDVVRTGIPAQRPAAGNTEEGRSNLRNFILGMSDLAEPMAKRLAGRLDLSNVRRMLDVGGGPGTYTFVFAGKNPKMECAVFDLPFVIPITLEQIEKHGMKSRVGTIQGNFLEDGFGDGYDLVLMSNVLHSNSATECRTMLRKGFKSLNPGGQLVVVEFVLDADRAAPLNGAIFSVNMLVGTAGGASWPTDEIDEWLRAAGFDTVERIDLPPQSVALVGRKPDGKKKIAVRKR